ncbi:bifunctional acetate--CoA ligase family protein/GNAT family N-acetyltransferase [Rhizobacter sp. Root16D2]|uniref:bifunctional acetate--CoA ligase family protein/GNAT family N-acetyltransferase n=1 Tax=Rhizobacter sp. Root16D2 TaxID=1736479 RepID=UPI0006FD17A8|nr:bifunctional acetate--CoA ligase family protein/GNAT family N-acetyltransferase [Rhizobacter sp. Root16D2]KRB23942.1 GCN5 family acetyltransferase [Rhizobacter sp. Root16D2]
MSIRHLDRLLEPRSVAVAGASDRPASVGATVWRNLRAGFRGPLHALNLRLRTLDGQPVFARPDQLPAPPDLAVLCTPPETLADLVDRFGRLGTRAAIVMTAGLTDAQKQAVLEAARPHMLRLLGPNCLGLLTPRLGLNASFAHTDALPGNLAFVSQSGALVTAVLDWSRARRIGFSHLVSLGEHADVDFGDLLDHLASDGHTRAILLYIESIGGSPSSVRKFMSAARAAARNKPVIVVKAGRAGNGLRAAASHTGALAGSDIVFDAAIRRAGMLRVDTLQDLFVAAQTLARFGANRDDRLTLVTNGGGAGVLAADAAARRGVTLAEPTPALQARLDAVLPAAWSHGNPVDIIGDAPVQRYVDALQAVLAEPQAGAVLFMHAPTAIVPSADIARSLLPLAREATGRLMACWLGDGAVAEARALFAEAGVADYATPEEAVNAFSMLRCYRHNQATLLETPTASGNAAPDLAAARRVFDAVRADGRELLQEHEAKAVLAAYGIPVVRTLRVDADADAAAEAAGRIGYPVALKIASPDITHKSDVGGVALGLADEASLRAGAARMLDTVRRERPQARVGGFNVQAMASRPMAQELIVGASIDPSFGPVLMLGHGGTAVEVLADRAIGLPPLNRALARELVSRTAVSRLLAGYRDHPAARLDAVGDVLIAVSQMLADLPELAELDINPLWADGSGVLALDARIRLGREPVAGAARFAIRPYPDALVETLPWQGEALTLRPVRPEDEPAHRRFVEQLSPDDLRFRFFNVRRELAHSELARLTQIDYAREMAFVAVRTSADGTSETLGVARAAVDPDNQEAEFAVVVRSDLQGRGLGRLLMGKLIAYQAAQGTQRLVGLVLHDNLAMRAFMQRLGFEQRGGDGDALRLVLPLQAPPVSG